jgi:hypothetical protein
VALTALLLALSSAAQTIQFEGGAFKVAGWRPDRAAAPSSGSPGTAASSIPGSDFSSVFAVYAVPEGAAVSDVPPMLGSYSIQGDTLIFQPRFPLSPGLRYRAVFKAAGRAPVEAVFNGPKRETTPSTRVERVYPSTSVIPANELKLYIYFSGPMSRGEAWTRIHLLDENGKLIQLPFVEIDQELWDPSGQRLTVLFDPGRIKRGLVPNKEVGPPIVEGKQYTLVIDRDFKDARGVPLVEGFKKQFRGAASDRTSPDPKQWRITAPKAGTTDAVVIDFPESLDYALMQRLIAVAGVTGSIAVGRDETQWRFTPDDPWKRGDYQIVVDTDLEDLAGNQIGRVFDLETTEKVPQGVAKRTVSLSFAVR